MLTKFEADHLCQNITYITTKDSGFRVSLLLSHIHMISLRFFKCLVLAINLGVILGGMQW